MRTRDRYGKFNDNGAKKYNNGYPMTYMPEHHRAKANGYVYDHVLAVEKKIRRPLLSEEVVHHLDGNPNNNDQSNLIVLENGAAHARIHWAARCKRYYCNGKMLTLPELVEISGLPYHRIYQRIHKLGWSAERAVAE